MKIFTNLEFDEAQRKRMMEIAGEDDIYFGNPEDPTEEDRENFIVSTAGFGWCPPEWLEEAHTMKWMQLDSVGFGEYTHLDWDRLGQRLNCTNLKGFFAVPVAETVIAGIMSIYRQTEVLFDLKKSKKWDKLQIRAKALSLDGKNVLIAGYGSIGQRVDKLLKAFGCSITTYDKYSEEAMLKSTYEMEKALPYMDIVAAAMPDTAETRGLFNEKRIGMMKDKALFINVGRGSLVDEKALVQALNSGKLGGAVLDVTETEPLPANHLLWDCPNTILTQHTAGGTSDELDRKINFFEHNLSLFREGKPLENMIDWKRGY